jgi:hypothetical protein
VQGRDGLVKGMSVIAKEIKELRKFASGLPAMIMEELQEVYGVAPVSTRSSYSLSHYDTRSVEKITISDYNPPTDAELCGPPCYAVAEKLKLYLKALMANHLAAFRTIMGMIETIGDCQDGFPITLNTEVRAGCAWHFGGSTVAEEGEQSALRRPYCDESVVGYRVVKAFWPRFCAKAGARRLFGVDSAKPWYGQAPLLSEDLCRLVQYATAIHTAVSVDRKFDLLLQLRNCFGLFRTMGIELASNEIRRICLDAHKMGVLAPYRDTIKVWYGVLSLLPNSRYAIVLVAWATHDPKMCAYEDVLGVLPGNPNAVETFICEACAVLESCNAIEETYRPSAAEQHAATEYHGKLKSMGMTKAEGASCVEEHSASAVGDAPHQAPRTDAAKRGSTGAKTSARDYGTKLSSVTCKGCATGKVQQGVIDARATRGLSAVGFCLACHTKFQKQHFFVMPDGTTLESRYRNRDGTRKEREPKKKVPAGSGMPGRATDWSCGKCNASCWATKDKCYSCGTSRPASASAVTIEEVTDGGGTGHVRWGVDSVMGEA